MAMAKVRVWMAIGITALLGGCSGGSDGPNDPAECFNGYFDPGEAGTDCGGICSALCMADGRWNAAGLDAPVFSRFSYTCPSSFDPNAIGYSIWGTGVYTDDSDICPAAVHDGRITTSAATTVTIELWPDQLVFTGSTQGGVTSDIWDAWWRSYVFVPITSTLIDGASCSDGVRAGSETDVDCGGYCAAKCAAGQTCLRDADCAGGAPCVGAHAEWMILGSCGG